MMSFTVKTTLILCILQVVAAVPQILPLRPVLNNARQAAQQHMEFVRQQIAGGHQPVGTQNGVCRDIGVGLFCEHNKFQCNSNQAINNMCKRTCGLCPVAGQSVCNDISADCQEQARSRKLFCQSPIAQNYCQLTCRLCGAQVNDVSFGDEDKNSNAVNNRTISNDVSAPNTVPSRTNQPVWTDVANACIIGKNDKFFQEVPNIEGCKAHCQAQDGCNSVEYNSGTGNCVLSKSDSRSPNYRKPCPENADNVWKYLEIIKQSACKDLSINRCLELARSRSLNCQDQNIKVICKLSCGLCDDPLNPETETGDRTLQNTSPSQNQHSPQPSTAQPQQNGGNQGNSATSGGQQSRPSNTNTNHQVQNHGSTGASVAPPAGRKGVCTQDPNPGECRGAFPRFYFNKKTDQCDCFLYGGCGDEAIESSWLTLRECHANCIPNNKEEGPRCKQLPKQDIQVFTDPSVCRDNLTNCENSRDQCNIYPAFRKGCARTCGLCTDVVAVSQAPDTSNINDQELISSLGGQNRNSNN